MSATPYVSGVKKVKKPKWPTGHWEDGEWIAHDEEATKIRKQLTNKAAKKSLSAYVTLSKATRTEVNTGGKTFMTEPSAMGGGIGHGPEPPAPTSPKQPAVTQPVGNPEVRNLANRYTTQNGLGMLSETPHLPVNEDRAKRMADHYAAAGHNPGDPDVQRSYAALKHEVNQQYEHAQNAGYTFTPWGAESQPYRTSREMMDDVRNNRHLGFFTGGDMPADHPLAEINPAHGITYNDQLRAIHDLYGHSQSGFQFGARGEDSAWKEHKKMFTSAALPALTQETRMQNSTVNFGKHLRKPDGSIPRKGEEGYIPPEERPFAPQHANLPPSWAMEE